MIDLHCHLLPGIDDGPRDLETALEMARIAVEDGIVVTACTPHIYPGLYENTADGIRQAVRALRTHLRDAGIDLEITFGADIQVVPDLLPGLQSGRMPTLHGSRYFLFEPPHHVAPPRFLDSIFNTLAGGYVPVITHPERLTWIGDQYDFFPEAVRAGAWIQITAGALTGRFGRGPKYWSEKLLDEGMVHILASDGHDPKHRPPCLAEARGVAARWVGDVEADRLARLRPAAILRNADPATLTMPTSLSSETGEPRPKAKAGGWLARLFGAN